MNLRINLAAAFLLMASLPLVAQTPAQNPTPEATQDVPRTPARPARTCCKPDANGVYNVGGPVTPPRLLAHPDPEYSDVARRKKLTGFSTIALIVDTDGNPQDVHVSRSLAEGLPDKMHAAAVSLDEKAIECVRQYRFEPSMYKDKPVPVKLFVQVNFQIY